MEEQKLHRNRVKKFERVKLEAISLKYQVEEQITDAISKGDMKKLKALLYAIGQDHSLSPLKEEHRESLLEMKLLLFVANTYSRIAAKNGGLDSLYIHLISERYSNLIQEAPSISYMEEHIYIDMFMEYCESVKKFSTTNYSTIMKEIVSYISENLTSEMTLTSVSNLFGIHPVHLARKFKQETGNTFIGFVNQQRINLAKYFFHIGKYQLSEVANLTGFNSHSYFTKVFKKVTDLTPTEYIRSLPSREGNFEDEVINVFTNLD